ncbi:hypothetical protein VTL71DRAFT_2064, partial [Oculimacula yallundae]
MLDQGTGANAGAGLSSPPAQILQLEEHEEEILKRQLHTANSQASSLYLVQRDVELRAIGAILLATLAGTFTFGNIAPNFQAFTTGVAASGKIFNLYLEGHHWICLSLIDRS